MGLNAAVKLGQPENSKGGFVVNNLPIEQIQKELDALIKMGLVKVIVENGETNKDPTSETSGTTVYMIRRDEC